MSKEAFSGGCQCGAVRFRLDASPRDFMHCRCCICRRGHGALFATATGAERLGHGDGAEAERDGNPEAVFGALFTNDYTQMDDQQHTIATLIAAREVLIAEDEQL